MIVEIFSCSGGMAEGLRRAGLQPDIAFDYDADACDSYERNLGHRPIRIDVRDLLRMTTAGWSPGSIDLLVADPPCTPWSRAGKRLGQADERDMLSVTVELIRAWRPRFALIANVPGLDDGPNWPIVQREIGGLSRDGYCVDFERIDAATVGVPQHRVRPFWFLHPMRSPHIEWPERTHAPPGECGAVIEWPWDRPSTTVCEQDRLMPPGHHTGSNLSGPNAIKLSEKAAAILQGFPDGRCRCEREQWAEEALRQRVQTDSISTKGISGEGTSSPIISLGRATMGQSLTDLTSTTRTKTKRTTGRTTSTQSAIADSASSTDRSSNGVHDAEATSPSPKSIGTPTQAISPATSPARNERSETASDVCGRCGERRRSWHFAGATKRARWAQIGMAMPPPMAEAVARSIARAMAASAGRERLEKGSVRT